MLLAEDLLLLLTDDRTGKLAASGNEVDLAIGGALLVELTMSDRVEVAERSGMFRSDRVVVKDAEPVGDEILDEALAKLVAKDGRRATDAVGFLGKKVRRRLYGRLAQKGVLRTHRGRILGIFPTEQWPAQDAGHEDEVRRRLVVALQNRLAPDERTAALVSLLHALRRTHKAVDPQQAGMSRRELGAAAKRIAEGDWASAAVRRAIDSANAAVVAAASGAAAAGAGSS